MECNTPQALTGCVQPGDGGTLQPDSPGTQGPRWAPPRHRPHHVRPRGASGGTAPPLVSSSPLPWGNCDTSPDSMEKRYELHPSPRCKHFPGHAPVVNSAALGLPKYNRSVLSRQQKCQYRYFNSSCFLLNGQISTQTSFNIYQAALAFFTFLPRDILPSMHRGKYHRNAGRGQ